MIFKSARRGSAWRAEWSKNVCQLISSRFISQLENQFDPNLSVFASVRRLTDPSNSLRRCVCVMLNELFISCVFDAPGQPSPSGQYLIPGRFYPLWSVCVGGSSVGDVCVL